jgi:hypothetical protein
MILEFDDLRKIRWLSVYGASVAVQAEAQNLRGDAEIDKWRHVFERAKRVANMDKENGGGTT